MTDRLQRSNRWLWLIVVAGSLVYAGLSSARYAGYNSGMLDLGNMSQAIWSAAQGRPLLHTNPAGNVSRLAGHVELTYFALAPLLLLWPDPRVLLIAQSVLFASGAFPVYHMARRRLPTLSSFGFAVGYLLFPTAVSAVLFDLHGDTLAMPLLLWMLWALDVRAWRRFWCFLLLSLFCKVYIAAPIFALGLTLLFTRTAPFDLAALPWRRELGVAVCAVAAVYGLVIVLGVRPFFANAASAGSGGYARYYFGAVSSIGVVGILDRLINLLAVLMPTAFLWWRARWTAAPGFAIIGPALLSTGPGAAYAWSYHHYAAAVPFLVAASVVGATQLVERTTSPRLRRRDASAVGLLFFGASLLFHIWLNDTPFGITFWRAEPGYGPSASGYGRTSREALKDRWLEGVSREAPVAASNFLAPHLFRRDTLYLVRYPDEPAAERLSAILPQVQVALPDALFDFVQQTGDGFVGGVAYDRDAIRQLLQSPEWTLIAARDGLLRFERVSAPAAALRQRIASAAGGGAAEMRFGDAIELVTSTVEPQGGRRYRASFRWRALRDFEPDELLVAVSRLEGLPHTRMVHLPSYALRPTPTWRAGEVWEEEFEIELPADIVPGQYRWQVGWFDTRNIAAAATDERSRIGGEANVTVLELHEGAAQSRLPHPSRTNAASVDPPRGR